MKFIIPTVLESSRERDAEEDSNKLYNKESVGWKRYHDGRSEKMRFYGACKLFCVTADSH